MNGSALLFSVYASRKEYSKYDVCLIVCERKNEKFSLLFSVYASGKEYSRYDVCLIFCERKKMNGSVYYLVFMPVERGIQSVMCV